MLVSQVVLIAVMAVAVCTDLGSGKIRNWLTIPAIVVGPVIGFLQPHGGVGGLMSSLGGAGVMILVGAVIVVLRIMGGGDVKLLVAAGSLGGLPFVGPMLEYSAIAGGVVALLTLLAGRRAKAVVGNVARAFAISVGSGAKSPVVLSGIKIRYSIALAVGTVLSLLYRA